MVAKSPPDGYTLLETASVHVINPLLYKNVPYDVVNDFTPIMLLAVGPLLVSTPPNVPANNLKELFDIVRKDPKKYTFGTTSIGSASHLAIELLKREAKLDTLVVPYKGTAPALTDLMSGQIQLLADPMLSSLPLAQGKKTKALAVTSLKRVPSAPEIPTVEESAGFKGFEFVSWYGLWAPKNLPADISQEAAGGRRQGAGAAGNEGAARQARLRGEGRYCRGLQELHRHRDGEIRKDHQGRQDQGGVRRGGSALRPPARRHRVLSAATG